MAPKLNMPTTLSRVRTLRTSNFRLMLHHVFAASAHRSIATAVESVFKQNRQQRSTRQILVSGLLRVAGVPIGEPDTDSAFPALRSSSYVGDSRCHGGNRFGHARCDARSFANSNGPALRASDRRASIRGDEKA